MDNKAFREWLVSRAAELKEEKNLLILEQEKTNGIVHTYISTLVSEVSGKQSILDELVQEFLEETEAS